MKVKVKFGSIQDFRKECIDRTIHIVRRDYAVETKIAETSNAAIGKVGITRFKLVLTATDGKDVLRLEHAFYSCMDIDVNSERTKREVEERTIKVEEQLHKDFPAEYKGEDVPDDWHERFYQFVLKKGVIEEL